MGKNIRELTLEERRASISVVVSSMMVVEQMSYLKDTTLWRGSLKEIGNKFFNCVSTLVKQNDNVYKANPTIYTNVHRDNSELVKKLSKCNSKDLALINQIHDYYKDNPEEWDSFYQYKELNT